jgi:DNA-binding transcriptional ArsR family regulator
VTLDVGRWEWEKAVRTAGLPMAPALVAFALATYADADGTKVRPSQSTVASGLGVSRSTVVRAMRRLRDDGYLRLVREPGPGRTAEYRLTLHEGAQALPKGGTSDTEVGHQRLTSVAPVPQHQTRDQSKDQTPHQNRDQNTSGLATAGTGGGGPWDEAECIGARGEPDGSTYRSRYITDGSPPNRPARRRER